MNRELRLQGPLRFAHGPELWAELRGQVERAERGDTLDLDMSAVQEVDGGAMALLAHVRAELQQRGVQSEFVGAPPHVQELIHLYRGDVAVGRRKRRRAPGTLDQIGRTTMTLVHEIQVALGFLGQMLIALAGVVRRPRTSDFRDLSPTMERTGADAVPIVLLINFLVGLVMAFQSSIQLQKFGATIFVADLVGIAMARELGPLMTAIIVTGRSGAAFAAELGSMRVNEEIDALRTMGFSPLRFLVFPRTLALILMLPLLTLLANVMGILGGMTVAVTTLDMTGVVYLNQTQKAVTLWDLGSGLWKSGVFGLTIGLISCQQGMAASGGAEGVGRRTTAAVVAILFMLILLDAIFAVAFHGWRG